MNMLKAYFPTILIEQEEKGHGEKYMQLCKAYKLSDVDNECCQCQPKAINKYFQHLNIFFLL